MATIDVGSTSSRAHRHQCRSRGNKCRASLTLLLAVVASCCAAQQVPTEAEVKAAYLYNFGKFVAWPSDEGSRSEFQICILGKDPFGAVLDSTVTGAQINRKPIKIRRLRRIGDARGCHVLYISTSEESRLAAIFPEAQRLHLLTVSDIPRFAERGGNIGLVTEQDRIRFEVNLTTAEGSHLSLSSELLKVATRVIQKPAGT